MKYSEFKKTYAWMIKTYPGADSIFRENMTETIGTCTTIHYEKNGNRWTETGRETKKMTRAFYCNSVDAIPFFRNLGGREQVETGYSFIGFLPIAIHSTSPDRKQKTVRKFSFNK